MRPFTSPLVPRGDGGSTDDRMGVEKEGKERNSVIDEVVFEQFKHASPEKGYSIYSCGVDGNDVELGTSSTQFDLDSTHVNSNNDQETRKRRIPFEGMLYPK